MRTLILALVLAQPQHRDEVIYTPNSSAVFTLSHLRTLSPRDQQYAFYLSLYNVPKERRKVVAKVVSLIANSLSTRRKMYIPEFVVGSDETLIYLNISNYEWLRKFTDDLAAKGSGIRPFPDVYFHSFLYEQKEVKVAEETVVAKIVVGTEITTSRSCSCYKPGTNAEVLCTLDLGFRAKVLEVHNNLLLVKTNNGRAWVYDYDVRIYRKEVIKLEPTNNRVFASGLQLDKAVMTEVITRTQAKAPILRADWFIVNASLAPAYYDFLKLDKTIRSFEDLIYSDEKLAKKARSQDKAVVIQSFISRNNRTLTRSPTFTKGYYWSSHDTLKSVDDRKYIQNFLDEKFDATEDIGTLPNGLQAYFITNGQGNRLDAANTDVVVDNTAVDRVVRCARSCIVCHSEGIKPIKDSIRALTAKLKNKESIKLLNVKEEDFYRVQDLFGSNIDKQIILDQQIYTDAVTECTGVGPAVIAKEYLEIYNTYAEKLLNKETIALDAGISVDCLERLIRKSDDPVLLGLIKQPFSPVRRDQFEESFQGLMMLVLKDLGGVK